MQHSLRLISEIEREGGAQGILSGVDQANAHAPFLQYIHYCVFTDT